MALAPPVQIPIDGTQTDAPPSPAAVLTDRVSPKDVRTAMKLMLVQLMQVGVQQQQNFVTFNHQLNTDYLENKRSVSPREAIADIALASTQAVKSAAAQSAAQAATAKGP